MKILIIKMNLPYPPDSGTRIVSFNLIKSLSKRHEVSVVSLLQSKSDAISADLLRKYCYKVETIWTPNKRSLFHRIFYKIVYIAISIFMKETPRILYYTPKIMHSKIKEILAQNHYDIVQIEYWYSAAYIRHVKSSLKILLCHDIEHVTNYRNFKFKKWLISRLFSYIKWKKEKKYELNACKDFDIIFTLSRKDKEILQSNLDNKVPIEILPVGIDLSLFKPKDTENETKNLIFVGAMYAFFNIDAMLFFCNSIFPFIKKRIPDVKLYIVGAKPPRKIRLLGRDRSIIVTGYVKDVRQYIQDSSVYIAPIRIGSGKKIKIIEAMAMGKPVVTTTVGTEGIDTHNGEDIIITDNANNFALKVINLLENVELRQKISKNARKLIETHYNQEIVNKNLLKIYEEKLWRLRS